MASAASFSGAGTTPPSLPVEMWVQTLSHLLPSPEVYQDQQVCRLFQQSTLPAIHEYLGRQETVTAKTLEQFHLPLFYYLIYNAPAFAQQRAEAGASEQTTKNIWVNFSVPQLFAHALSFCKEAKEVDLTGSRYSSSTFIGEPEELETEVTTLEWTPSQDCPTYSQIDGIMGDVPEIFGQMHPQILSLPKVETLKLKAGKNHWESLATIFPHLKHLSVAGGPPPEEAKSFFTCLVDAEKDSDSLC